MLSTVDERLRELLVKALELAPASRERLAEALLESLAESGEGLTEDARAELGRRLDDIGLPGYRGLTVDELLARLDEKIAR